MIFQTLHHFVSKHSNMVYFTKKSFPLQLSLFSHFLKSTKLRTLIIYVKKKYFILYLTSRPGPGAARKKFNEIKSSFWTFFGKQSFFSSDLFRFWSLGYFIVRGLSWRGHTCVKNLPRAGVEVCTKFGGDWCGGWRVKEGHRYKQSVLHVRFKYN